MGKKKIDAGNIAVGSFLVLILLMLVCFFTLTNESLLMNKTLLDILIFLIGLAIFVMTLGIIGMVIQKNDDKNDLIENINAFQNEYDNYIKELGIVQSDTKATLIEENEYGFNSSILQYLWIKDNTLNIFPLSKYYKEYETSAVTKPDISKLKLRTIPLESILYFEEIGELRKYTTLSGGGTSLKGALLGYVIADDVGAIIGSREPIKTEVISEDDRRIELIYANSENEIENLEFTHDAYEVFRELIPLKELRKIIGLNMVHNTDNVRNNEVLSTENTKEKLRQLNEMKEEGLISDIEFVEKRKQILDLF